MKKSWKYGLITGGASAILAGGLFLYSGYAIGRMPTLPTPPGVVVPPGLRYVGGDEFDAPDGTKPDEAKWELMEMSVNTHPVDDPKPGETSFNQMMNSRVTSKASTTIEAGAMELHLNKNPVASDEEILRLTMAYGKKPMSFSGTGRLEMRVRVTGGNKTNGNFSASTGDPPKHSSLQLLDFGRNRSEIYNMLLSTGHTEAQSAHLLKHPAGNDGRYHIYTIEWKPDSIAFVQDGNCIGQCDASQKNSQFVTTVIPREWLYKIGITSLLSWKKWVPDNRRWRFGFSLSDPVNSSSLEIDYIRIFQSE